MGGKKMGPRGVVGYRDGAPTKLFKAGREKKFFREFRELRE
jgi:hypothetical protein